MIIAIDGPAGAGKSTVAKEVAKRLSFHYLDTGAMYRAVTYLALKKKMDLHDTGGLVLLAATSRINFRNEHVGIYSDIYIDGERVTEEIRSPQVDKAVSVVSRIPEVRRAMLKHQRCLAGTDAVVEGRDIGTVVFPDATVKIYLTASVSERARRRLKDMEAKGHKVAEQAVEAEIKVRDELDSTRLASPLAKAPDAVEINTTGRSVDEVVDEIMSLVKNVI